MKLVRINANIGKKTRYPHRVTVEVKSPAHEASLRRNLTKPKYPWDEWCSGGWWKITRGEDFEHTIARMQILMNDHARDYGYWVRTFRSEDGVSLYFEFYTGRKRPRAETNDIKAAMYEGSIQKRKPRISVL